jgi:spore coat polysaccharide biosynthesis protein SpsF
MGKTIACVIARTVSTRLPLKVLRQVTPGYSMLDFMLQRLKRVAGIDKVYLCTSSEAVDDILEDVAEANAVHLYRGAADAVIERIIAVGEQENADNVIRITGDNVFTTCEYLDRQIRIHQQSGLQYTRIIDLPIGATAEVMTLEAVRDCYGKIDPAVSEYLLLYMFDPNAYRCGTLRISGLPECSRLSLTVDTPADLQRTRDILRRFQGEKLDIRLNDILSIVERCELPQVVIPETAPLKMPYGKTVTFGTFLADMQARAAKSQQITIED